MFPPASILSRRPESRSVKSASPSGRKANPHGTSRSVAITLRSTSTAPPFADLSPSACGVSSSELAVWRDGLPASAPQAAQERMTIRVSAMGSAFAVRFGKAQPFLERPTSRRLYAAALAFDLLSKKGGRGDAGPLCTVRQYLL